MGAPIRIFIVLAMVVTCCHTQLGAVTTTKAPKPARDSSPLEIAILLAGIIAATTISVTLVLVPTIVYHNYHRKTEEQQKSAEVHREN